MKRSITVLFLLAALPAAAQAAGLERELRSRWLGAWVVVGTESYSDCLAMYTNNRLNGTLVKSRGRITFGAGELAKVDRVNAKRSRLDLQLSLTEPLLLPYSEGPFTLYRESLCRIELEVEIPRNVVRNKDVDAIEKDLAKILQRHATRQSAEASELWNRRQIDPYPEDYEQTLADLEVWRAHQLNSTVQAKLDLAHEVTFHLADRLISDPDYLRGFAEGVEAARAESLGGCASLLELDLDKAYHTTTGNHGHGDPAHDRATRGYADGMRLVYGLELMRQLPACFVSVPDTARLIPRPDE